MPQVQSLRSHLRASARAVIIDAAEHVAATQGIGDASLQAIARHAGVAVGTLYNYFDDRQALFDELFARRREELYAAIESAAARDPRAPFAVQLDAFLRTVFTYFDTRRSFLRLALETEHGRPIVVRDNKGKKRTAMAQLQTRAEEIVRIGIREKRLRERPAHLCATVLVAVIRGVLVAEADSEELLVRETENAVDIFLHGAGR